MTWTQFSQQPRASELLYHSLRNERLAHAYLLAGPKGAGKKQMALHLAKSLFCPEREADACGACLTCRRIEGGNHPDVLFITPDGASIKIDQIRALQKEMAMRAVESQHKVYIIEHVDKMTTQAANSLLKFLEEPPAGVLALLLTEHSHAMLPTILSRCQIVQFSPLSAEAIAVELRREGVLAGMAQVASHITTNMEEAKVLSQSESFAQLRNLVIQLIEECKQRNSSALFTIHDMLQKSDKIKEELPLFLDLLILWLRDILYVQVGRHAHLINSDQQDVLQGQALVWTKAELLHGIDLVMETKNRIERNANAQLALERLVLQIQEG
ncbi:DNA polymerase III subunit delta' [Brevibacillus centrosporus]|jgi:DNA polymerase-3 subunit delta'|uniref:DNA polymerase III subunit delta' n=1 Tax=Brevibacillus centrosporus TaxID=54910 RepID=A0A1I4BUC6_9BACL|nr:DNA polymerase III subunit delta' [Brevibacillus centrosporus]MEC2132749.1 DNA polymerase III subunit delta' [Brevibacillus centrosporus]MED4908352.1 DNA polymerase III subunit delta' [Brevibacillus centrosporus]RNB66549.1 DNA polymerase III subunit delta' [Brevibacillus centrosporus]SFK71531.1 DNA polymerase-3 subunit delta' [Brevibacillus centrosporus]GED33022.1 DNA polymerase III subunit delta' [Brevibacillus centrosporus]